MAATSAPEAEAETAPPASIRSGVTGPHAARPARSDGPSYSLMTPPSYDGIVGGVAPSPFASFFLLVGIVLILASVVGYGAGKAMTDWLIVGAALTGIAAFLAAFISRGA